MRKKPIVIACAIVLYIGAAIWMLLPSKEPVYGGEPLSYWLSGYTYVYRGVPQYPLPPSHDQADEAIRAIGTNAIPGLLRRLQGHDSALGLRLYRIVKRQWFFLPKWQYHYVISDVLQAERAFDALGPQAASLLPKLTRIYNPNPNPYARQAVMKIACKISPPDEIVPLLLRGLAETNDFILRNNAAYALGEIRVQPDVVVPALMKALNDPEVMVRAAAAESLGQYGSEARAAEPVLRKMLKGHETASPGTYPFFSSHGGGFSLGDPKFFKGPPPLTIRPVDEYGAIQNALLKINDASNREAVRTELEHK